MKPSQFATLFFMLAVTTGCTRFYAPTTSNLSHADAIKKAKSDNRYFILRDSLFTYSLTNVEADGEKNIITCNVDKVPPEHTVYVNAKKKQYNYSKAKGEDVVLKELHIYSSQLISTPGTGKTEISLSSINRIEEINYDAHRTKKQHIRVWLITGGIVVVGVLITGLAVGAAMAAYY